MFAFHASLGLLLPLLAWADPPELVSVKTGGIAILNHNCQYPTISKHGDIVAFEAFAGGIVPEKPVNGFGVYVRNVNTNETRLVSANAQGVPANSSAGTPRISDKGDVVAFDSNASNLVPSVPGGATRIYLKNMTTGAIQCATRKSTGTPIDYNNFLDGYALSGNGRFVAFISGGMNVTPDDTQSSNDVFVYDALTESVELVSKAVDGGSGDHDARHVRISKDGRFVIFSSLASNLVADDQNGTQRDVFLRDRKLGKTKLLSRCTTGLQSWQSTELVGASKNGKYVLICPSGTLDPNLEGHDLFVVNTKTGEVEAVGTKHGDAVAHEPERGQITNDGRYVVFESNANGFTKQSDFADGYDIVLVDRKTQKSRLLSVGANGLAPNGISRTPVLSADGRIAAFFSEANDLVPFDGDDYRDVFRIAIR